MSGLVFVLGFACRSSQKGAGRRRGLFGTRTTTTSRTDSAHNKYHGHDATTTEGRDRGFHANKACQQQWSKVIVPAAAAAAAAETTTITISDDSSGN